LTSKKPQSSLEKNNEQQGEKRTVLTCSDGKKITLNASAEAFGSENIEFSDGLMRQIVSIGSQGKEIDVDGVAFVTSIITGIKPRDELEAMLAAQMAAIHNATITFSRRLAHVDNIRQQDSAERTLNKLARTYVLQMQALQKYRSGGKQSVVVKHVHINDGGQAIVGNIDRGAV
jgi:hypothetical protein